MGSFIILFVIIFCIIGIIQSIFFPSEEPSTAARRRRAEAEEKKRQKLMLEISQEKAEYRSKVIRSKEYSIVYGKIFDDIKACSKSVEYSKTVVYHILNNRVANAYFNTIFEFDDFEFLHPSLVSEFMAEELKIALPSNFKVSVISDGRICIDIHNGDKKVI